MYCSVKHVNKCADLLLCADNAFLVTGYKIEGQKKEEPGIFLAYHYIVYIVT